MLQNRNEEINDDNLNKIVKYLEKIKKKENQKKKPDDVKVPNLKRASVSDSDRIASLGGIILTLIDRYKVNFS